MLCDRFYESEMLNLSFLAGRRQPHIIIVWFYHILGFIGLVLLENVLFNN